MALNKLQPPGSPGPLGPEGVPIPGGPLLASPSTGMIGQTVDGIQCESGMDVVFHIHAHLTIFVNGSPRRVPAGIGIPGAETDNTALGASVTGGSCLYWIHTHAADGIIHVESPAPRTYTLGDLFDIWGQPLGRTQAGPERGPVTAFYNGKRFEGDPRNVPLDAHAQIQLDVGHPVVAPVSIQFPSGL